MEHPIKKIGDHISFSTYKLSPSNLFVFGMNHARSNDSDYKEVESRILNLVENNPGLVILKEGVIVDEDNMPKDELGRRIFLAFKHKIAGMKVLANTKEG